MPTPAEAVGWADTAMAVIRTPYPFSAGHVATGPDDTDITPQRLHPAFHGSLDWHSCVHMCWSLLTLLERYAGPLADAGRAQPMRALLAERLTPEQLAVETAYLRDRPSFERPYGWAWAAALNARLRRSRLPEAQAWAQAMAPLTDTVLANVLDWLPRQAYPVRHGKHQNDAFALSLLLRSAAALERPDLAGAVRGRAMEWFGTDAEAPTAWEPSGTDFLSPALSEAELMLHVLPPAEYAAWLARFLPGLGEGRHTGLLSVPDVRDGTDGQLVHLAGLALSRAWQLRALAPRLPAGARETVRAAADAQVSAVAPRITDGDFMATHWLVSFALLADGALDDTHS